MKCKNIFFLIALTLTFSDIFPQQGNYPQISVPQVIDQGIPNGWLLGGSNPQDYTVGTDLSESVSGYASAYIKSASPKPVGFVTLMQNLKTNNYRSRRVRLTAYVKTKFVSGWSAVWMRVDDINGKLLSFDDMRERPLRGTMEWSSVEIVLDVPTISDEISFGVLLQGKGQVWIDNVSLNIVGNEVPVTDILKNNIENYSPKNLDFEE